MERINRNENQHEQHQQLALVDVVESSEFTGVNDNNKVSTRTRSIILDSLPYIDPIREDYEQYALVLIEEEMKETNNKINTTKSHDVVSDKKIVATQESEQSIVRFRTDIMKTEYTNLIERRKRQKHDRDNSTGVSKKYSKIDDDDDDKQNVDDLDEHDVTLLLKKARIEYEAERIRSIQLLIEQEEFATNHVRIYTEQVLQPFQQSLENDVAITSKHIDTINYQRQHNQRNIYSKQLVTLEQQYNQLIQEHCQLRSAVQELKVGQLQEQTSQL